MDLTTLLRKLIEIEQSVGNDTDAAIRKKMRDLEDYVLEMQKEKTSKRAEHKHHAA